MRKDSHLLIDAVQEAFPSAWRPCRVLSFALLLGFCALASAEAGFVAGSYQVDIGESVRQLDALLKLQRGEISTSMYNDINMQEMCRNPSIRLIDRNRPAILLQNTSDESSDNELSQFTIDLQELGYEFGNGDFNPDIFEGALSFLSPMSDAGISISSSYGTVSDSDPTIDHTKLVLDISGLTAGKAVMFRFDIDPVPMIDFLYPDYRMVVLGGDGGSGPSDPALISATFSSGEGDQAMSTSTDFRELRGEFQEDITSGVLEAYGAQSNATMTSQSDMTIPEPSAGALLLIGMGLVGIRRHSR